VVLPSAAGAATVNIGQVAPAGNTGGCISCTFIQPQVDVSSPSYTVPAGNWTVTSWSLMSGTTTSGEGQLEIWRPEGANFRLIAQSITEGVIFQAGGTTRSFSTSIPVQGGDVLGQRSGNPPGNYSNTYTTTSLNDVVWGAVVGDPAVGQSVGPTGDFTAFGNNPQIRVNVAATVFKPDPVVLDTTPPETLITSGPGKTVGDGKAKFRFSSEPGATFMCKLDRKPFQPCTSPKKYKNLAPGKHKFRVQAADASANVDATPAKKKFSVPG
jgi:hypothetical protein